MQVMTIAPRYDQYSDAWDTSTTINVLGEEIRFFHSNKSGVDRVFVDHPMFLAKVRGLPSMSNPADGLHSQLASCCTVS